MQRGGSLELVYGCMWSGKTETLCTRLCDHTDNGGKVPLVLRPALDTQNPPKELVTHAGRVLRDEDDVDMLVISKPGELDGLLKPEVLESYDCYGFDEAQFFDPWELAEVVLRLQGTHHKRVIVAGLNRTYEHTQWLWLSLLVSDATISNLLYARCDVCGNQDAIHSLKRSDHTQPRQGRLERVARSSEGAPVLPGGKDLFTVVCATHLPRDEAALLADAFAGSVATLEDAFANRAELENVSKRDTKPPVYIESQINGGGGGADASNGTLGSATAATTHVVGEDDPRRENRFYAAVKAVFTERPPPWRGIQLPSMREHMCKFSCGVCNALGFAMVFAYFTLLLWPVPSGGYKAHFAASP